MSLKPWKKISEETLMKNPWWQYILEHYELPDGKKAEYHRVHKEDAVVIVPITEQGKIVLVRCYRPMVERIGLEFPMGTRENKHTIEQTALEELSQEAGYGAGKIEDIGALTVAHGIMDQWMYGFIAWDLYPKQADPDETEEFEVYEFTVSELESKIRTGEIVDQHTIANWFLAKPRVLEIIDAQERNS